MRAPGRPGRIALLALLGACVVPSGADAAKSPLYKVSLTGSTRTQLTRTLPLDPPEGCMGEGQETDRFAASARFVPRLRAVPLGFGTARIDFTARLASRTVSADREISGNFTQDPGDPTRCTFTPRQTPASCHFVAGAIDANGTEFSLAVFFSTFRLSYRRVPVVSCRPNPLLGDLFTPTLTTRLSVRGVERLRLGRSLSASGSKSFPPEERFSTGQSRISYTVKVRRVR